MNSGPARSPAVSCTNAMRARIARASPAGGATTSASRFGWARSSIPPRRRRLAGSTNPPILGVAPCCARRWTVRPRDPCPRCAPKSSGSPATRSADRRGIAHRAGSSPPRPGAARLPVSLRVAADANAGARCSNTSARAASSATGANRRDPDSPVPLYNKCLPTCCASRAPCGSGAMAADKTITIVGGGLAGALLAPAAQRGWSVDDVRTPRRPRCTVTPADARQPRAGDAAAYALRRPAPGGDEARR